MSDEEYRKALREALDSKKPKVRPQVSAKRTELAADAPAPRLGELISKQGLEPTEMALYAWDARVKGSPIVDVAHEMGVSIEAAKVLIGEVHTAIHEDLKANLDLNRSLDLARIDGLLQTYYPAAKTGDQDCAGVVLKCLAQRSKLTGIEPMPDPGRSHPENVLIWIQSQLPNINRIVDSLPLELPPSIPTGQQ